MQSTPPSDELQRLRAQFAAWIAPLLPERLMDIDDLLPLPTQPLHVIAFETRDPRLSPSDTAIIIEAVNRLRRVAKVTGADISVVIGLNVAEVLIVGAVPDLIGATREGSHHVEVIDGVRVMWSAS